MKPNELTGLWPYLTPPEREETNRLLTTDPCPWRPLPGPQAQALETEADVTFYTY